MASLVLSGDTSGSITVAAPAVSGSTTQTLVNVTGTLAPVVSGTAVTASSTSVDFTSIPSWVKRVTVMFSGVSLNATAEILVQIGTSSGVEITGYASNAGSRGGEVSSTAGYVLTRAAGTVDIFVGNIVICAVGSNTWVASGVLGTTNNSAPSSSGGTKTLAGVLDRVRITSSTGTATFDAGTINILYE